MSGLRELYAQQIGQRGFRPDPAQLKAVSELERLRSALIAAERGRSGAGRWLNRIRRRTEAPIRGIYLWGGVGRGKTWLMDLFFQSLPFAQKKRRHFHRFMQEVHAQLKSLGEIESPLEKVAARLAEEARVLCFDELFVSDIADAMILGALFSSLFERGVTVVFTSNLPPRELYRNGLQRQRFIPAIELIESHTQLLNVDGAIDYRLRQLTQAGTYLQSSAPETSQRLQSLFEDLSDGDEQTGAIEIEGRRVPIRRASDNVAWFDFEALCEGPRGTADYIQLAREYKSILVSDIPILDETRENAARRLIALVDELYDRNVNLIVSAAAPLANLYRGEKLRHEFQRTASRLTEMQSQEYLAREHKA